MPHTLTLLTWPDYIDPQTLQQFESEFGVGVKLEIVPSAVELIERMQTQDPGVDVLVPPDYAVRELNLQDRLLKLDHSHLPNLEHLEPRFDRGRAHDPESLVSVLKDWGTTGFMYRTDLIHETLTSWADFWRLAEKMSGCVTVLDSPGEVIGAALKMRGHSYNAASPDELAGARDDLLKLKPQVLAFETNYKSLLASGKAYLSLGWNGDAAALIAQGIPIRYVLPNEGSQIWEDDWAIASTAPHPDLAHAFLNFVLRPDIAAQEARFTRYATGNQSAWRLLDEEMRSDPSTYPPQELLGKLEAGMPIDAEGEKRRAELWNEVRGFEVPDRFIGRTYMKLSLGVISLLFFLVSVLFLVLLTLFESSLTGLSLTAERTISLLLLVLPALLGIVFGIGSIVRKESRRWMGILGITLNAVFALFHLFLLSFAG